MIKKFLFTIFLGLSAFANSLTVNNNIAYVADITGMPSLISKFFAIPKMKDYNFSILLIDEDNKALFPVEQDKITIITLDNSKVTSIKFIKTAEDLATTLK
jgi:hypothetical protein